MSTIYDLIDRFEKAVRADEMKGTQPPDERADIEQELKEARGELEDKVEFLY